MRLRDALILGRSSNLPTIWTNVLAATVLAGGAVGLRTYAFLGIAVSLFYLGGMYLNDAFDRRWDAEHRPERPIPAGRTRAATVFACGFALLAGGVALVAFGAEPRQAPRALAAAVALAATIVFYDAFHKRNPLAPLVMGACRVGVYAVAAYSIALRPPMGLWIGAGALLAWLIGLTYAARSETTGSLGSRWPLALLAVPVLLGLSQVPNPLPLGAAALLATWAVLSVRRMRATPPDIGGGVARLIAGICLVDATLIAMAGAWQLALIAALGLPLTRLLQRYVPGT